MRSCRPLVLVTRWESALQGDDAVHGDVGRAVRHGLTATLASDCRRRHRGRARGRDNRVRVHVDIRGTRGVDAIRAIIGKCITARAVYRAVPGLPTQCRCRGRGRGRGRGSAVIVRRHVESTEREAGSATLLPQSHRRKARSVTFMNGRTPAHIG